jgi:2-polyprenyl-3-methyl-5-hydroxy-6-metoxy-1,4-benzoquinol methylase
MNMRQPAANDALGLVRESLLRNYFKDSEYLASEVGRNDLAAHLESRLTDNRERVVPWIESFFYLPGARVLEIGCGTGSSTLALVERGAALTAVDILPDSIQVASDRCSAYGYQAKFLLANAAKVGDLLQENEFEAVIFHSALEHMTHEERRAAMQDTWEMLSPGAYWIIIETPNRLWFSDAHTSLLPFFNWLPDQLAFEYSRFSPRPYFRELYTERTPEKELHFLRRGRGVSFHEFELYMAPLQDLEIVSCLHAYWHARNPGARQAWVDSNNAAWEDLLRSACPGLHPAFLQPYLNFAIRKN